jgi:hypothetical protein
MLRTIARRYSNNQSTGWFGSLFGGKKDTSVQDEAALAAVESTRPRSVSSELEAYKDVQVLQEAVHDIVKKNSAVQVEEWNTVRLDEDISFKYNARHYMHPQSV